MNKNRKLAIAQLKQIEKLADSSMLLAADWKEEWKVLISTTLSAQTKDETTIKISKNLYERYVTMQELANARLADVAETIKPVNYHKTKAKHIIETAKIITSKYHGKIQHDLNKLLELPGVGRKTANVFLAVHGHDAIGIDTHLAYCSRRLGWSKGKSHYRIEKDLEQLFPKRYWRELNYIIVRFGRTYRNRKRQNEILDKLRKI